ERQLQLAHYSLLPNAVIGTGYADRNNEAGGSSRRLPIGTGPIGADTPSTSTERDVYSADLALSWNVLDFGLSYVRARQAADKILIARENRRKVVNRIVEDVRTAFWRAVTAERLIRRLRGLEHRVVRALANTQVLSTEGDTSPLTALTFERELVEIKREIQRLSDDLGVAKLQLAALMNVRPGENFRIAVPRNQKAPPFLSLSAEQMVTRALEHRPELLEVAYEKRINRQEATAAMLEILPSVSANVTPNWNSNAFLFNQNYLAWGAQASWNLLKVFSYRAREAEIDARDDLLNARALAVTMAVMTQVHVSRARLIHARKRYRTAAHFMRVQSRILEQIRSSLAAGKVSEQTAIREEMNTLIARVKLDLAYVEVENAYGNAHASMGANPFAHLDVNEGSLHEFADALDEGWRSLGATTAGMKSVEGRPGPWRTDENDDTEAAAEDLPIARAPLRTAQFDPFVSR
ncbi:MAG: TolC family protein, partial [Hyphomicrobiaceae bacterium]